MENHLQLNLVNSITWKEVENGQYIPSSNFNDAIFQEDAKNLNDINWRKIKLTKSNLTKFKLENLKPGDIVYHKTHGYLKLERSNANEANKDDNSIYNWECSKHKTSTSNEPKADDAKMTLSAKEFEFYINVDALINIEKKLGVSRFKVNISDSIRSLVEPIEKLHNSSFLTIFNGKGVDVDKAFYDYGIKDNDKLFLNGVFGSFDVKFSSNIRFFKRFRDFRSGDSWYMGRDRWDALVYIPSRNIKVLGIGLYEAHPDGGNFTLGYKYHIEDSEGTEIFQSPLVEEEVTPDPSEIEDHIIKYKFKTYSKGIPVKAGERFNFCMWMTAQRSYYSESGENYRELENQDQGFFEIRDSSYCTNSTRTNRGVLPGILYSL